MEKELKDLLHAVMNARRQATAICSRTIDTNQQLNVSDAWQKLVEAWDIIKLEIYPDE